MGVAAAAVRASRSVSVVWAAPCERADSDEDDGPGKIRSGPASMRNPSATTGTNADSFLRLEVITGVGRRRRWSLEKARIVAESLDPATTSSAVARRYGLHASQLFVWRQLQRSAAATAARGE